MSKLTLIPLAALALMGTVGVTSAQYGGGYYGGPDYRYQYRERYYGDDDRYYRRRYYSRDYGASPACYNYYGRRICCPGGFTVQDGVCKPYRGY